MIAAVLLAAGNARRFDGSQKLLAPVPRAGGDAPLVRCAAEALIVAGLERIVVVLGREADAVGRSLDGLAVRLLINAAYVTGMSSSLRAGVGEAVCLWPATEWVLIALGDQPLAGTGVVEALARACRGAGRERATAPQIIAPRFRGEVGNPVLFARALVPELLSTSGDRGARSVVERDPTRVRYVDFAAPAPPDVDTVQDLAALRESVRRA